MVPTRGPRATRRVAMGSPRTDFTAKRSREWNSHPLSPTAEGWGASPHATELVFNWGNSGPVPTGVSVPLPFLPPIPSGTGKALPLKHCLAGA